MILSPPASLHMVVNHGQEQRWSGSWTFYKREAEAERDQPRCLDKEYACQSDIHGDKNDL